MISASIPYPMRRQVYRRDGYRCALCDSTKYLQIHHLYPRSIGGAGHPMNLITLCMYCHAGRHPRRTGRAEGMGLASRSRIPRRLLCARLVPMGGLTPSLCFKAGTLINRQ